MERLCFAKTNVFVKQPLKLEVKQYLKQKLKQRKLRGRRFILSKFRKSILHRRAERIKLGWINPPMSLNDLNLTLRRIHLGPYLGALLNVHEKQKFVVINGYEK